jgi:hypothetical protein
VVNETRRQLTGPVAPVTIACHMVAEVVATASPLQPLRKRGRPPSSQKSIEPGDETLTFPTPTTAKVPRLYTSTTPNFPSPSPSLRGRGRPSKRFLTAVSSNSVKIRSGRWHIGEFVCTVCGRDCGYRQNLYVHMKRHVKYGEAASASTVSTRGGRRQYIRRRTSEDGGRLGHHPTAAVTVRASGPVLVARKNEAGRSSVAFNEADKTPCRPR